MKKIPLKHEFVQTLFSGILICDMTSNSTTYLKFHLRAIDFKSVWAPDFNHLFFGMYVLMSTRQNNFYFYYTNPRVSSCNNFGCGVVNTQRIWREKLLNWFLGVRKLKLKSQNISDRLFIYIFFLFSISVYFFLLHTYYVSQKKYCSLFAEKGKLLRNKSNFVPSALNLLKNCRPFPPHVAS